MIEFSDDSVVVSLAPAQGSTEKNSPTPSIRTARMTHFPSRSDALVKLGEESLRQTQIRACTGCGRDFLVMRAWQRQCSQRCRQRAYIQRKCSVPHGYYGA